MLVLGQLLLVALASTFAQGNIVVEELILLPSELIIRCLLAPECFRHHSWRWSWDEALSSHQEKGKTCCPFGCKLSVD